MTHIYLILPLVALGKKSEKTDGGRKIRLERDNKFNYRKPGSIQKEDTSRPSINEIQETSFGSYINLKAGHLREIDWSSSSL